jgi:hypothetical protein
VRKSTAPGGLSLQPAKPEQVVNKLTVAEGKLHRSIVSGDPGRQLAAQIDTSEPAGGYSYNTNLPSERPRRVVRQADQNIVGTEARTNPFVSREAERITIELMIPR